MDLSWTAEQQAFRAEAHGWLEANVPADPLPSGDTAEGFALHLEWERKLFDAGWAVVSWPEAYGGRDATLWDLPDHQNPREVLACCPGGVVEDPVFMLSADRTLAFERVPRSRRLIPVAA